MKVLLTFAVMLSCFGWLHALDRLDHIPVVQPLSQVQGLPIDPAHYDFANDDLDKMLQLIERYRNLKPAYATLEYGVMFYPEKNPATGALTLIAKASVIFPYEAVPLNLPGNYFPGQLEGGEFFSPAFLKTFKQDPALANGATQAYTFAVLYENQVQILLDGRGVQGIKVYNVEIDYLAPVPKTTTTKFFNLNIVGDNPKLDFGSGAQFLLAIPCPPYWRG